MSISIGSQDSDDFDLDVDSSEIGNLVSITNPPDGCHIYGLVFCGVDTLGNKDESPKGVKMIYQLIGTAEKTKESDLDAPVGSIFQESFTGNDMGKKLLKLRISQIFGAAFQGGAFRQYIDALQEKKMSEFHLQLTTTLHTSACGKYENVRIKACAPVACQELPQGFEQYEYEPKG